MKLCVQCLSKSRFTAAIAQTQREWRETSFCLNGGARSILEHYMARLVKTEMILSCCSYLFSLIHCHQVIFHHFLQYPTILHPSLFRFPLKQNVFSSSLNIPLTKRYQHVITTGNASRRKPHENCRVAWLRGILSGTLNDTMDDVPNVVSKVLLGNENAAYP